jgi:uncharacterized protein YrzB (UPF0473 family)
MNDREIKLFLEDGSEVIFKILFTFHHDERNADFVLVYDEKEPENVMLFQYFDDQTISSVDDPEILEEAQELLDTYEEENLGDVEVPEI